MNKQLHLWQHVMSSPEYKAIRGAMQLRRNRLVFRASYGQPQFSTMTGGIISGHNQWAGKPPIASLPPRTTDVFTEKL